MDEFIDRWMEEWMDGLDGRVDVWMSGWTDYLMDGCVELINEK